MSEKRMGQAEKSSEKSNTPRCDAQWRKHNRLSQECATGFIELAMQLERELSAVIDHEKSQKSKEHAITCSTVVFRVQDRDGRGPWKPGFSERWVEDRDDHDNLLPWYMEMGPVHQLGIAGMHRGTACETLEQLRRWFTKSEYRTLRRYGYQAVQMEVGRILGKSETQLVFERAKPCNIGCAPVDLYPSNADSIHP